MSKFRYIKTFFMPFILLIIYCATSLLGARYYRLLESERKIFLGLKSIDSLSAMEYLELPSPTERSNFYKKYWEGKPEEAKQEFERRIEYAYRMFAKYAPLDDDRITYYCKYGEPTNRLEIITQKAIGIAKAVKIRPAEIWTYKKLGFEIDFVKLGRAYKLITESRFGEGVKIPHLSEVINETSIIPDNLRLEKELDFDVSYACFRQAKNLVRVEIYTRIMIDDTVSYRLCRKVNIIDKNGSIITEKNAVLVPQDAEKGLFYDEINFWLESGLYDAEIEYYESKRNIYGKKRLAINILDYKDDARKVSDILIAKLIDEEFTDAKFDKPFVGRVIPTVSNILFVKHPFYLYVEAYNLGVQTGQYHIDLAYEVYELEKGKKEFVDFLKKSQIGEGNTAFVASKYHPMDLPAGRYLVVLKIKDLINNEEISAVKEFCLVENQLYIGY